MEPREEAGLGMLLLYSRGWICLLVVFQSPLDRSDKMESDSSYGSTNLGERPSIWRGGDTGRSNDQVSVGKVVDDRHYL